jgi:hypothetical protein
MYKFGKIVGLCLLTVAVVLIFGYGLRTGNMYIQAVPILVPFLIFLISKPEIVFLFTVAIINSNLVLPGFSGDLELYHVLFFMVTVILFVRKVITKERSNTDGFLLIVCGLYVLIAFYTMLFRGIGFRIIGGGEQAGGMRYVLIYLGFINIWLLPNIQVSQKALTRALVVFALLSFLPVLSEGILLASGGRIYHHYYFFKADFGLGDTLMGSMQGAEMRYMSASILGNGLIYLPFFLIPFNRKNFFKYAIFIGFGLIVTGFSGFRSVFIASILFLFISGFFLFPQHRKIFFLAFCVSGFIGYFLVLIGFDYLPFGIQRTVAFLPFVGEGSLALRDGQGTANFRFNIWILALREVPEYLWLGRGLAFDYAELKAIEASYWMSDRIFMRGLIGNLHNGPLEVLVYLGVPAVLMFSSFLVRVFQLCLIKLKQLKHDPDKYQLGVYFVSILISTEISFLLTFGNPYGTFYRICINISLLQILQQAPKRLGPSKLDSSTEL